MPFELPDNLHPNCGPVAWLLGTWRGNGHGDYPTIEKFQFGQELIFTHDGRPFFHYMARAWIVDEDGEFVRDAAHVLEHGADRAQGLGREHDLLPLLNIADSGALADFQDPFLLNPEGTAPDERAPHADVLSHGEKVTVARDGDARGQRLVARRRSAARSRGKARAQSPRSEARARRRPSHRPAPSAP